MELNDRFAFLLIVLLIVGVLFCFNRFKFSNNESQPINGYKIVYKVENNNKSKVTKYDLEKVKRYVSILIETQTIEDYSVDIKNKKVIVKMKDDLYIDQIRDILSAKPHEITFRDTNDNILMDSSILKIDGAKAIQDKNGRPALLLAIEDKDKLYTVTNKLSKDENNTLVIWFDFNDTEDSYQTENMKCGTDGTRCLSAITVSKGISSDITILGDYREEAVALINDLTLSSTLKEESYKEIHYVSE